MSSSAPSDGEGDLVEVTAEADPRLEIPEIHRRVIAEGGPALLFRNPKGSRFPVVTNLFGTKKRIELAFGTRPAEFMRTAVRAATELLPPTAAKLWSYRSFFAQAGKVGTKRAASTPVTEVADDRFDLTTLPALTTWPEAPATHTYVVYDFGDLVTELANEGLDTVEVSEDIYFTNSNFYALGANVAGTRPMIKKMLMGGTCEWRNGLFFFPDRVRSMWAWARSLRIPSK